MSEHSPIPENETGFDRVLAFTIPDMHARGRTVRIGPVLDAVLSAHDYPTAIRHLLAEALVVSALIGSLLKDEDGQLTMQAQSDGGIVELVRPAVVEVMDLLRHARGPRDVRVRRDEAVPPRRAGAGGADADVVGWAHDPSGRARRGG